MALLALVGCTPAADPAPTPEPGRVMAPVTVVSYNVRGPRPDHVFGVAEPFTWPHRRDGVLAQIRALDPDIAGLQEVFPQFRTDGSVGETDRWLADRLPGLETWTGESSSADAPPVIMWRKDRFRLDPGAERGTAVVHPYAEDNAPECWMERDLGWVVLRELASGQRLVVATTHLPATQFCGAERERAAGRVLAVLAERNPERLPVLLTGDLNDTTPDCVRRDWPARGEALARLLGPPLPGTSRLHAPTDCTPSSDPDWPFAPDRPSKPLERIDHVLASDELRAVDHGVGALRIRMGAETSTPSDHRPVWSRVEWAGAG